MYHSISDSSAFFAVTPSAFAAQMALIHARGMKSVFASDVPALLSSENPEDTICVTFDDGYKDNYITVFPILKKYGIRATIFLITDYVGAMRTVRGRAYRMLSEEQIKEMHESGLVEFMPHTQTHPDLDRIPLDTAIREIEGSRTRVEALTGKPANLCAYPRGRYTHDILEYLRDSEAWRGAFGVVRGFATTKSDRYLLPRNAIDSATGKRAFSALLKGNLLVYRILKAIAARSTFFSV